MSEPSYSSPGPSLKRKRTDTSDSTESANEAVITRSDIWFDDGNVILQAQTTQFRVHRGVIGRHSNVFKDMFAMPQPSGEPAIEGCAVVHLMDTPQDWQNILLILYDSSLKAYKSTNNMSFYMIESMLRLGRKYEFDHLRDLAVECLQTERPRTLELWETKYGAHTVRADTTKFHTFDFINLILESGIKSILPTALYACIEDHSLEEILQGSTRPDGTSVYLAPKTQVTLALGKEKLLRSTTTCMQEWFAVLEGCLEPLSCSGRKAKVLRTLLAQFTPTAVFSRYLLKRTKGAISFCEFCQPLMVDMVQAGRKKMWDELPGYFGFQEWADLKDD